MTQSRYQRFNCPSFSARGRVGLNPDKFARGSAVNPSDFNLIPSCLWIQVLADWQIRALALTAVVSLFDPAKVFPDLLKMSSHSYFMHSFILILALQRINQILLHVCVIAVRALDPRLPAYICDTLHLFSPAGTDAFTLTHFKA